MDKTTKILLAAIALGLFANAAATVVRPAAAQFGSRTVSLLQQIEANIANLANGVCVNRKLCGP